MSNTKRAAVITTIWMAMCSTHLVLPVVGYFALQEANLASIQEDGKPFVTPLLALAGAIVLTHFIIRTRYVAPQRTQLLRVLRSSDPATSGTPEPWEPLWQGYCSGLIALFASAEAITIVGLAVTLLSGEYWWVLACAAVGGGLACTSRLDPQLTTALERAPEANRSGR